MNTRIAALMCGFVVSAWAFPGAVHAQGSITREQAEQLGREIVDAAVRAELDHGPDVSFDGMRVESVGPDRLEANDVRASDVDVDIDTGDDFDS